MTREELRRYWLEVGGSVQVPLAVLRVLVNGSRIYAHTEALHETTDSSDIAMEAVAFAQEIVDSTVVLDALAPENKSYLNLKCEPAGRRTR